MECNEPVSQTVASQALESSRSAPVRRQSISSWLLSPDLDLYTLTYRELLHRQRLLSLGKRPRRGGSAPTRRAFHSQDRKKVCETALANPSMSHQELADLFNTNKTTITRTLQHKEKWLRSSQFEDLKVARDRYPVYDSLDCDIHAWLIDLTTTDTLITDDMLKDKAMSLAREYHLIGGKHSFTCSRTWLRRIKSKYGIVNGRFADFSESLTRRRDQALGYWTERSRRSMPELAQASRDMLLADASTPLLDVVEEPVEQSNVELSSPCDPLSASPSSAASSSSTSELLSLASHRPNTFDFNFQSVPDDAFGVHRPLSPQSSSTIDWSSIPTTLPASDNIHTPTESLVLDSLATPLDPSLSTTFFLLPTSDPAIPTAQVPTHDQGMFAFDPSIAPFMDTGFESSLLSNVPADCSSSFQGPHGANFDQISDDDFMRLASQLLFDGGDTFALPGVDPVRGEQVNIDAALLEPWTTGDSFAMEGMPYPPLVPPS